MTILRLRLTSVYDYSQIKTNLRLRPVLSSYAALVLPCHELSLPHLARVLLRGIKDVGVVPGGAAGCRTWVGHMVHGGWQVYPVISHIPASLVSLGHPAWATPAWLPWLPNDRSGLLATSEQA